LKETLSMLSPSKGSRALLRHINQIMLQPSTASERLKKIVVQIAQTMVAEVCSVYISSPTGKLELIATEGLKENAIGKASLVIGEGLVGLIAKEAKPVAVDDAPNHPEFKFLPNIGEEPYKAFLGVPILRSGQTLGVLVIQNRVRQDYKEEDIEALEIIAHILSDLIINDPTISTDKVAAADPLMSRAMHLKGSVISTGIGIGQVVLHQQRVAVTKRIAEDIDYETTRLKAAVHDMRDSIDKVLERTERSLQGESAEIMQSIKMFAYDKGWYQRMNDAIQQGLTAEAAVEQVQSDARARLLRNPDAILADRLHDLEDLTNRMLRRLMGLPIDALYRTMPDNPVLVARHMGPAELLDYTGQNLAGVIVEDGSHSSHVAIVARALGIPSISQLPSVTDLVEDGDAIILDGQEGDVHIRPTEHIIQCYEEQFKNECLIREKYSKIAQEKALTKDGVSLRLMMNAGLLVDMGQLFSAGAEGVGLFRTEFQYMIAQHLPRIEDQVRNYATILDMAGEKPVVFRTLDIGGDKRLSYIPHPEEENPALGLRAIRLSLQAPAIFRKQIRSLLRAAGGRHLNLMFPMVSDISEFHDAKKLVEREFNYLTRRGHAMPRRIHYGVMLEVPSLLFVLDELCKEIDFLSIGSNDLMQFFFAIDRDNHAVSNLFDIISHAPLRALRSIVQACEKHNVNLSFCGEVGSDPVALLALMSIGIREISMSSRAIGRAKYIIQNTDISQIEQIVLPILSSSALKNDDLREKLSKLLPENL